MNEHKNKQHPPQGNDKQDSRQANKQDQNKRERQPGRQDEEQEPMRSGMDQPGDPEKPEKKTQIDDNPDETKKKIPNM